MPRRAHHDCLTVLAVRKPDCVIGIGHALGLEGTFVKCCFFHDEEMALPVKFTCVARCHCPVNYEWFVPQRKIVEVTEKHGGYNVTITACVSGRGETCSEDSIGYIFRLDGEGNTANQIISALKRHYMFFTSRWIESFHLHFTPFLYLRQMVEEFLEQLRGNNDFLKLLGGIVTDQDFRCQNEELLKIMYREYEGAMLTKPVMEENKDTGSLTMARQPPPAMRDSHSLLSSCTRTDDGSSFGQSLSTTEELHARSLNGQVPFESDDSRTTVVEDVVMKVMPRVGHDSSVLETTEEATTKHENIVERARGGVFESKKGESIDALQEELAALFAKYGRSSVISTALGMQDSPPTPTCDPVQAQDTNTLCNSPGNWSPYAPAVVTRGSEMDRESPESAESDMYRS